ncbi:MAG: efflux RND transporter permease subunit [Deltaproteobacteria bacterium]
MLISDVSVRRPVLATVMTAGMVVFGLVGYSRLPVRELPNVEYPVVSVSTVLPGASAEVVETEITEFLEEEINGIQGIEFIRSVSKEEVSSITVQFALSRPIDAAAQDVRDRVARARNKLPDEAKEPRVTKIDMDAQAIMWLALHSKSRHPIEIMEYADKVLKPRVQTISGVGRVMVGGSNRQAMRVEIDRERLAAYGLTVSGVATALRTENIEIPSGRVEGRWREFVVRTEGEFESPEKFRELIVSYAGNQPIRLGDVAQVRRGYQNERVRARFNGIPTSGLGIVKQSGANTLAVANEVKRVMREERERLPEGFNLDVAYDQSGFIERSVHEVRQALVLAGVLVLVVIFVFLQSARTTLIPSLAMPSAIIATFGVIYFLGFTINTLTLMALTLVVGVVVDDAIIVLENIYRHMEAGADRIQAAHAATAEIAFAVISTTLTLLAVFVPIAFLSGVVGRFFYEFGISVAVAVAASSFIALTLTPMLCSRFLTVRSTAARAGLFGSLARLFDDLVKRLSDAYERLLDRALDHRALVVGILVAALGMSVLLFTNIGKEFIPTDDRGYLVARIKTPEGSTLEYQDRYQRRVEAMLDANPDIRSYFSVVAITRGGPGKVNTGVMFVRLQARPTRKQSTQQVVEDLRASARSIAGADVAFFVSNALHMGSRSKPVRVAVQHPRLEELSEHSERLRTVVAGMKGLRDVETDLDIDKPQLAVAIERDKAAVLGVSATDIAETLRMLLGSDEVTHYTVGNERYNVILQLAADDRFSPGDLEAIYVRSRSGELMPLANVVSVTERVGPSAVNHYDRKRSVIIDASLDGTDLGTAVEQIKHAAKSVLPEGFTTALVGQSREYQKGSEGLGFTFVLALVAIYLVLAGQFESFIHPLTIMMALPLAMLGALVGLSALGMTLNVYSFIGIIMLMGLVTKNSILLVDYINVLRTRGVETREAILEAGRIRLRPILMTALSTIFGILPIALGTGAGAETRRPLGVAVVAGMTTSTLLTLVVVPVFYSMIDRARTGLSKTSTRQAPTVEAAGAADEGTGAAPKGLPG